MTRLQIMTDTRQEVASAAYNGASAAYDGAGENACPFGFDTAQGIIWIQAFRLTRDRMEEGMS
jgi:hypothetical protein